MIRISVIFLILLSSSLFGQTNWYVDYQNGSDLNNGTSPFTAVKTVDILTDNDLIQPKDFVFIIGQYNNPSYDPDFSYGGDNDRNNPHIWHQENSIKLSNLNGAEDEYITFKPYDNSTVLKGDGANIFRIFQCSYLRIEGFEIYGEVENIPLSTAEGLETPGLQFLYLDENTVDPLNPTLDEVLFRVSVGTTIEEIENTTFPIIGTITRPSYTDTRGLYLSKCDHIEILNNTIHHTPGGGLRVAESSYVNIIGNEVHNCSRKSYSGTHALVVTKTLEGTANSADDPLYSAKIQKNIVWENYNEIFSWVGTKNFITPRIDEGKGISLQRNNLDEWKNGTKRILAENNICYWNGFSGVHSNEGWHIDFVNNSCYKNSYTNTITYAGGIQQGNNIGISAQGGEDIRMINNISVIDTDWGGFALSSGGSTGLVVEDNVIYGTNGIPNQDPDVVAVDINTTVADPAFVNPETNNFKLLSESPAINIGNAIFSPIDDFDGKPRNDGQPDIGAYEFGIILNLKVFLEGPFIDTEMSTQNKSNITLTQPYNLAPWNYQGTETVNEIPDNVVDWVLIEIRDTTDVEFATDEAIIAQQAAFLLNDGKVVGLDGYEPLLFLASITNKLFTIIWHRNHLGILTAGDLIQSDGTYYYDFTTSANKAYGIDAQKDLGGGMFGMYGGDANADNTINDLDKASLWSIEAGLAGYLTSDFNLDGRTDNKDKNEIWIQNDGKSSQVQQ